MKNKLIIMVMAVFAIEPSALAINMKDNRVDQILAEYAKLSEITSIKTDKPALEINLDHVKSK